MIVLVGFMGAGKTTVGHVLAERLGTPFVDSDVYIEQQLGRSIVDVFAAEGEEHFREIEHRSINELVRGSDAVLALGGGALGDPRTRAILRKTTVVYLRVDYDEALSRVHQDLFRPMLQRADLDQTYSRRLQAYAEVAAIQVDTNGRRPDAVALDVLRELTRLPSTPPGTSNILVTPVGGTYYAHVGRQLLDLAGTLLPTSTDIEQAVIVESDRDTSTADRVAASVTAQGISVTRVPVPDTEADKDLAAVRHVAGQLADVALHTNDLVVAVGGEPVCDLAGFVAATFNRGTRLALVPTTLVAQADSAIGGKNAINMPQGRNLMGTIHQPTVVIADVTTACANVERGFRAGLSEIAKHALISRSDLLHVLEESSEGACSADVDAVHQLVSRSLEIKADIVSRDERATAERIVLNYGHTFGHAIDLVTGQVEDQGQSVSLGMMAAAHLARRQGRVGDDVVDRHRHLLSRLGLPTTGRFDLEAMKRAWLRDKKYRHGVRFVVLNGLGRAETGVTASTDMLADVLDDLARR
ncbi:3-dehydroquinate synthase [Geodermatophilus tzadiensis]|uniref:Shikimate kinase n=1 Tax=Geodermatophilus tzadiensis TaxID=1137988 RepID=A0A2T0TTR3_9ACTN|nr:bifunctional shikimate kinase/3-dehydroquinate synthase [Geodermatophilus tzadiensis]PRY49055.1 3-dehydroquinate synthase [Geodermatophilus tzadiensis]